MIEAIIFLSIALVVSVVINVLLSSSKTSYASQIKKMHKDNEDLKAESDEFKTVIEQLKSKIESYEHTSNQKKNAENLLSELEKIKHERDSLKKENDRLSKQIESEGDESEEIAKLRSRIVELEKEISIVGASNDKIKKLETIIEEQKDKISSLTANIDKKEEEKCISNQRYEDASRKLDEFQIAFEQIKTQSASYQTQLISLQKQNAELNTNINTLTAGKAEAERRNNQLCDQLQRANSDKELLNQATQLKKKNEELKKSILENRKLVDQKENQIAELQHKIDEMSHASHAVPAILTEPTKLPIHTVTEDIILFKDGEYSKTLKKLVDISFITDYLNSSSHEKAQRYLKQVKEYAEEIENLEEVFNRLDVDEDELSSECINKFSRVFNEYMAENVIEPVFKAKDEESFFAEMFDVIMSYISKCGIYTKDVPTGDKYEKINYMEVITEDTTDPAQHKVITKILRLPFYAKYTSDTGKVREKLLSKGSCVVLKAK